MLRFGHARRIPLRGPWALVAGMVCIGIGTYQYLTSSTLSERGESARATVVDVDSRYNRNSGGFRQRSYALTLEFRDRGGKRHRERTGYSSRHSGHHVGERVSIVYNPADPSEFALDSWFDLWAMPLGFFVAGALGCGAFLFGPRRG